MELSRRQTELLNTGADFERAMTPPGWIFWDPQLYARDIDELFQKMWLCVGHRSRLDGPGSYFLVEVGAESVIVVADETGRSHAFFNVCRHRGTRIVAEAAGQRTGFSCPYHAWTYGLDGTLRAAPHMDTVANFDKKDYSLHAVRLDEFMGFLFINFDENAAPLANTFADLPDFSRFDIPNLVRAGYRDYEVESNWKVICENYHECYHCPVAHPQLHRISDFGGLCDADERGSNWVGGPMAIKAAFNTLTTSGITDRKPFSGCVGDDRRFVHYINLLPNFLLSMCADYVLTHHVWPRGPEHVYIETEWYFSKTQTEAPNFDPTDAIEFWDVTNKQDWALCENAMKGLKSRSQVPGRYQTGESCAHFFDQWYVRRMFADTMQAAGARS